MKSITIITPSFNSASFIEESIDSVLAQGYSNLEYIVIDGGSTDGTVDILKKYQKYFTYWVSESDRGQSNAINKGLRLATGEIVNWLNADDYYEKGALSKVAEYFQDSAITCYCGKSKIVDEKGVYIRKSLGTDVYKENLPKTIGWARIDQPETFFRKKVFEKLGGVNEQLHYVMDKELWIRYLFEYGLNGIGVGEEVIVNFRLHSQSKTGSAPLSFQNETDGLFFSMAKAGSLSTAAEFIKDIQNLNSTKFPPIEWPEISRELIGKVVQYYYLYLADYYYYHGRRKECSLLLDVIQERNFEKVDFHLYKKLKFRNKFVPGFLQKLKHDLL